MAILIHQEDLEFDTIDVMEIWEGVDLVTIGDDGYIEVFDDEGCDVLDEDEDSKVKICPS